MIDAIGAVFLLIGAFFLLVAALGTIRFPDLYTRMHAASKASSFGIGFMLIGVAIYFGTPTVVGKSIAAIIFIFLTTPIAASMIGRAGYLQKAPFWKGTCVDDLAGRYDLEKSRLE